MNAKRQTIWLVSMLSLMVVLSVYYLFTEDAGTSDPLAQSGGDVEDITVDLRETLPEGAEDAVGEADGGTAADTSSDGGAPGAEETSTGLTDEEILDKLAGEHYSADDLLAIEQMKRNEAIHKEAEQLLAIINDSEADTDTISKAYDDYYKLEQQEVKVNHIEETLLKDFRNAIVTEEQDKWKVIVQTNQLDRSQADSIIQMVVREMEVAPEKVIVQVLRP